jgi:hypothetical protein
VGWINNNHNNITLAVIMCMLNTIRIIHEKIKIQYSTFFLDETTQAHRKYTKE